MADAADEIVGNIFPVTEPPPPSEAPQAAPVVEQQGDQPPPIEPVTAPQAPAQAPVMEAPPQGGQIPIQALLDEREKRQKAEREAGELRAWRQQQEATRAQPSRPDPYDDPEAFAAWQQQQIAQVSWDTTRNISLRFAAEKHGQETVAAAEAWAHQAASRNPLFEAQFQRQQDPWGWLVSEYKRDQTLNKLGDRDLDAWFEEEQRRRAEQGGLGSGITPAAPIGAAIPPSPPAPPPPRSQASLPSANGGHQTVAVHQMAAVEGLFPKG